MSMQSEIKAEQEKILKDHLISDLRRQLDEYKDRYAAAERKAKDNLDYSGHLIKQLAEKDKENEMLKTRLSGYDKLLEPFRAMKLITCTGCNKNMELSLWGIHSQCCPGTATPSFKDFNP
jgi:hypothetical protein